MRITLKGQGKELVVRDIISKEAVVLFGKDSQIWSWGKSDKIMEYLIHYLKGSITKTELSYTLASHFEIENLHLVSLIGLIDEHVTEWKKWAKNPHMWYSYYHKDIDDQTKEIIIRPATDDDMPSEFNDAQPSDDRDTLMRKFLKESQQSTQSLYGIERKLSDLQSGYQS